MLAGWRRFLIYVGLLVAVPWLAGEVGYSSCVANELEEGDDSLCGLAYLVYGPLAFIALLWVFVVIEVVLRRRRRDLRGTVGG